MTDAMMIVKYKNKLSSFMAVTFIVVTREDVLSSLPFFIKTSSNNKIMP